ncbi:uncharacterized protein LOC142792727 [Rhipicephalus microplus]|uniref:uncharacterized protein LOC142792727 n=1 Tax=Rhipicephalus microplus TaxID=6941 RepID=UPI003F6D2F44
MWNYRSTEADSTCTWRHRKYINDTHVTLQEYYESGGLVYHFQPETWKFSSGTGTQKSMVLQERGKNSVSERLLHYDSSWSCAVIQRTKTFYIGDYREYTHVEKNYYLYTGVSEPDKAAKECEDLYLQYAKDRDQKHYDSSCNRTLNNLCQ